MTAVANGAHDERFLYLYLSLMVSIFSIVTLLSLHTFKKSDRHLTNEASSEKVNGAYTLHSSAIEPLVQYPLKLFASNDGQTEMHIVDTSFENLLFLLYSHDLNAVVEIRGEFSNPELGYAKALSLQKRLEQENIHPGDSRVELVFNSTQQTNLKAENKQGNGDVLVTFYSNR